MNRAHCKAHAYHVFGCGGCHNAERLVRESMTAADQQRYDRAVGNAPMREQPDDGTAALTLAAGIALVEAASFDVPGLDTPTAPDFSGGGGDFGGGGASGSW